MTSSVADNNKLVISTRNDLLYICHLFSLTACSSLEYFKLHLPRATVDDFPFFFRNTVHTDDMGQKTTLIVATKYMKQCERNSHLWP